MQSFIVEPGSDGKHLVRVILGHYPNLEISRLRQALRRRDVRVNGQRVHADCPVSRGDQIAIYLADEHLLGERQASPEKAAPAESSYRIVYQDPLLIIVDKKPGITVQTAGSDENQGVSLLDQVRADFQEPGIELCHRIDRQTGGLLMLSRRPAALEAIQELMRTGLIVKRYRCLVRGIPSQGQPVVCHDGASMLELSAWLEKDAKASDVYIHDLKKPGDLPIVTRYHVLRDFPGAGPGGEPVSELEVELVTGRTHQIRAHLSHIGHPLLGDGKYGRNSYNRHFSGRQGALRRQQLYSVSLMFRQECSGTLAYLAGKTFSVEPDYDWTAAVTAEK